MTQRIFLEAKYTNVSSTQLKKKNSISTLEDTFTLPSITYYPPYIKIITTLTFNNIISFACFRTLYTELYSQFYVWFPLLNFMS